MLRTNFEFESGFVNVENSPRWQIATGATGGATFGSGGITGGSVHFPSIEAWYSSVTVPDRANQSVEVGFVWETQTAGNDCGCFARYVDHNNYVALKADHGTRQASLIEVIGGVATTILTLAPSVIGPQAALRMELIGKRARVWFEGSEYVEDRPPDAAGNLSGDPTQVGTWGFFGADPTNDLMLLLTFKAMGLPDQVMPAPALTAASASGLNLTPVTLSIAASGGGNTEWQVLPVDWADIPEPFSVITAGSVLSLVVWVRPGYTYDARVRNVYGNVHGPWSLLTRFGPIGTAATPGTVAQGAYEGNEQYPFVPFAAYGSNDWQETYWPTGYSETDKAGPLPASVPDVFPNIVPEYIFETHADAQHKAFTSHTGVMRVASGQVRPRYSFKFEFTNRESSEYQTLIDFFEFASAKKLPFQWTHPLTGAVFVLRFNSDDYEAVYHDHNFESPIASLSFTVTEAPLVGPSTIPIRLLAGGPIGGTGS